MHIRTLNLSRMVKRSRPSNLAYIIIVSLLLTVGIMSIKPSPSSATDLPIIGKSGTLTSDETWSAGSVYLITGGVTVPSGVTLTVNAGAIVKVAQGSWNNGIIVNTGGTLTVNGTSADPVAFTSAEDDSVGGDSTNDGATTGTVGNYNNAISAAGGSINVSHASFSYGSYGITSGSGWNYNDGSLTIADSSFSHIDQNAINHYSGNVSLLRNSFNLQDGTGSAALQFTNLSDLTGITLSGADQNTFTGNRLNGTAVAVSGTVPAGKTWEVSSTAGAMLEPQAVAVGGTMIVPNGVTYCSGSGVDITVQNGGTLNVDAGAVIKVLKNIYTNPTAVAVNDGGTLNINGSATSPVTFTSIADDSIGGDTGQDGLTAGAVGDYYDAILANGGQINIAHGNFRYATVGIDRPSSAYANGSLSVTDSNFSHLSQTAISHGAGAVSLQRNTFNLQDGTGSAAINISGQSDLSTIVLSGADKNVFNGTRFGALSVTLGGYVPAGTTWSISSDMGGVFNPAVTVYGAIEFPDSITYIASPIQVNSGAQVDIPAGATIKIQKNVYAPTDGFYVATGGILNVNGDAGNPVVFTSAADDVTGGDTMSDGNTAGAVGDYGNAITSGGSVNVAHALFKYGAYGIGRSLNSSNDGLLTVTDSDFSHIQKQAIIHASGTVSLQRNTFSLDDGTGINAVQVMNLPDLTGVVLSGADKNTFTGTRQPGREVDMNGIVPSGKTWDIDASSGAIPAFSGVTNNGSMTLPASISVTTNSGPLLIESGASVTMPAGAVLKVHENAYTRDSQVGFSVQSSGQLNVNGTSANPATITSDEDDSIGGDTTGDGPSSATLGNYGAAIYNRSGQVNADHLNIDWAYIGYDQENTGGQSKFQNTDIDHANTGLEVLNGTTTYHGSIHNVTNGIYACDWGSVGCGVDAAYVDWGSANGPIGTASGGGNLVCGQVSVSPWLYNGNNMPGVTSLFSIQNCSNSNTPSQDLVSKVTTFQQHLEPYETSCDGGLASACSFAQQQYACLQAAVNLAGYDSPFTLPEADTKPHVSTFGDKVSTSATTFITNEEAQLNPEVVNGLIEVGNVYYQLNQAFQSCTP